MSDMNDRATPPAGPPSAATIGELRASGWVSRPVKQEVREHAIAKVAAGEPLFAGISGYEDTVMPQLENALLAGHDVIFLGERGQAKTRMIRSLTGLLDDWMPIVAGSEINDDPYDPVSKHARDLVHELGDDTPISWVHSSQRYGEKLATPDTSIADLIGEVDPIKVAEGRYLSDELTLHYGLVPRTNRGIFAINELPDLAERIQVGMLNVLEERDVQIRGYKIRLPLDVMLLASANPEDYTNRGRIITPLKDRFGSQIRTHYPLEVATEVTIMRQEATPLDVTTEIGGSQVAVKVMVPDYLTDVVATFSHLARASNQVNQRSGVSVRLSVSNYEALAANALRRGLRSGERTIVARVDDLDALAASSMGKIEIESLDEGRDGAIMEHLIKGAVLTVFKEVVPPEHTRAVVDAFEEGAVAHTGEGVTSEELARLVDEVDALRAPVAALTGGDESPAAVGAAIEFVLEGLHLSKRLNKDSSGASATYRGRT
jgi:magnesium chelatase subunit I